MSGYDAEQAVASQEVDLVPVLMEIGDVLIRHSWILHRETMPNIRQDPRPLVTMRYVCDRTEMEVETFAQFPNRYGTCSVATNNRGYVF